MLILLFMKFLKFLKMFFIGGDLMKNARIEIRISEEKKKIISEFAKQNNTTVSKLLNDLIDLVIQENTTK